MQNLLNELTEILQANQAFISDGSILKNAVIEAALNMDADLLALLMQSPTIKAHFFTHVAGALVFDKVKFQEFVSHKAFLPDSYTAYKNRIGLTDGHGGYLSQSRDEVLAWPYKDCVLEGGMTKEDKGRQEVFWNTTLAPDDITRLFEPKVLTGWERWDAEAVAAGKAKPVGEVSENDNLLIKGNNLLALHSLKASYAGKVKLIYIDPPYNTGSDEFKYNDRFNHSSWLTFIRNRLEVAKQLLMPEGSIFISIDANELGYLLPILDEIFGHENFAMCATVKRGSVTGHKTINAGVVNVAEYVVAYAKKKTVWDQNRVYRARSRNDRYNTFIVNRDGPFDDWQFSTLLDAFAAHIGIKKTQLKKQLGSKFEDDIYSFVKSNASAIVQMAYPDKDKVSADAQAMIEQSLARPDEILHLPRENEPDFYLKNGQRMLFYSDRLMEIDGEVVTAEALTDIWDDVLPNDLHNEGGVSLKKGKKPEKLIKRIMDIGSNQGDIFVDFFAGSGTSLCVAKKLGRRFIGVEQMDYAEWLTKKRLHNTISGEQSGISRAVKWQGGGSFVYAELAASNSAFATRIEAAPDTAALQGIWADMQATGYLRPDVDIARFDPDAFAVLPLEDGKRLLMDCLDANHLYVNLNSLGDADYEISDEDMRATRSFYGIDP